MLEKINTLRSSFRRIRQGAAMVLVQDLVIPWYESHSGEAANVARLNLKDEVARKCLEAFAGVVWQHRQLEKADPNNKFLVIDVAAVTDNGDYTLVITIISRDEDVDAEDHKLPLHAFLLSFEPIGEVKAKEYDA